MAPKVAMFYTLCMLPLPRDGCVLGLYMLGCGEGLHPDYFHNMGSNATQSPECNLGVDSLNAIR